MLTIYFAVYVPKAPFPLIPKFQLILTNPPYPQYFKTDQLQIQVNSLNIESSQHTLLHLHHICLPRKETSASFLISAVISVS